MASDVYYRMLMYSDAILCACMCRALQACRASKPAVVAAAAKAAPSNFDYDLIIIGCGVGGHGAALHAVESVSET